VIAEFDLDATEEVKRWVLSFGRHAEAVDPERLRDEIAHDCEQILREYERRAGSGVLRRND